MNTNLPTSTAQQQPQAPRYTLHSRAGVWILCENGIETSVTGQQVDMRVVLAAMQALRASAASGTTPIVIIKN